MRHTSTTSISAVISACAAFALAAVLPVACMAQDTASNGGHDSNTLHKIGKSIQYTTHKAAANASVTAHKGLHHNSVTNRKVAPYARQKQVVKPSGQTKPIAPVTPSPNP